MTLRLPYTVSDAYDSVGLQANFDQIARTFPVQPQNVAQRVPTTTAPVNPVDGQDWFYLADDTDGVVWHFKYRAGSASTFKWEFVGGPPLSDAVVDTDTTTSGSYADPTSGTPGPSVTVPFDGDYVVEIGCNAQNSAANTVAAHSYTVDGAAASDNDAASHTSGANNPSSVMSRRRHNNVDAATSFDSKYKTGTATTTTATFRRRVMHVIPVRVKG